MSNLIIISVTCIILVWFYLYIKKSDREFQSLKIGDKIYLGHASMYVDDFHHVRKDDDIEEIISIEYDYRSDKIPLSFITNKGKCFNMTDYRRAEFGIMKFL